MASASQIIVREIVMIRRFVRTGFNRAGLLVSAVALGLAAQAPAKAADEAKGKKVLMAQSFAAHPYVATIIKSFKAKAESLGMEVTVQAAGLDAALQVRQIDDGIARKFDMIVVQP